MTLPAVLPEPLGRSPWWMWVLWGPALVLLVLVLVGVALLAWWARPLPSDWAMAVPGPEVRWTAPLPDETAGLWVAALAAQKGMVTVWVGTGPEDAAFPRPAAAYEVGGYESPLYEGGMRRVYWWYLPDTEAARRALVRAAQAAGWYEPWWGRVRTRLQVRARPKPQTGFQPESMEGYWPVWRFFCHPWGRTATLRWIQVSPDTLLAVWEEETWPLERVRREPPPLCRIQDILMAFPFAVDLLASGPFAPLGKPWGVPLPRVPLPSDAMVRFAQTQTLGPTLWMSTVWVAHPSPAFGERLSTLARVALAEQGWYEETSQREGSAMELRWTRRDGFGRLWQARLLWVVPEPDLGMAWWVVFRPGSTPAFAQPVPYAHRLLHRLQVPNARAAQAWLTAYWQSAVGRDEPLYARVVLDPKDAGKTLPFPEGWFPLGQVIATYTGWPDGTEMFTWVLSPQGMGLNAVQTALETLAAEMGARVSTPQPEPLAFAETNAPPTLDLCLDHERAFTLRLWPMPARVLVVVQHFPEDAAGLCLSEPFPIPRPEGGEVPHLPLPQGVQMWPVLFMPKAQAVWVWPTTPKVLDSVFATALGTQGWSRVYHEQGLVVLSRWVRGDRTFWVWLWSPEDKQVLMVWRSTP